MILIILHLLKFLLSTRSINQVFWVANIFCSESGMWDKKKTTKGPHHLAVTQILSSLVYLPFVNPMSQSEKERFKRCSHHYSEFSLCLLYYYDTMITDLGNNQIDTFNICILCKIFLKSSNRLTKTILSTSLHPLSTL